MAPLFTRSCLLFCKIHRNIYHLDGQFGLSLGQEVSLTHGLQRKFPEFVRHRTSFKMVCLYVNFSQQIRLSVMYLTLTTVIIADITWSLCVPILVYWVLLHYHHTPTNMTLISYKNIVLGSRKVYYLPLKALFYAPLWKKFLTTETVINWPILVLLFVP